MEFNEIMSFFERKARFVGRTLAYYEDGSDFGVVSVIAVKSNYVVGSAICVFNEADGKLLTINAKRSYSALSEVKTLQKAPYGKEYCYSFENAEGRVIYVSPFEKCFVV